MAHKKKIALAGIAIILASVAFIIFSKDSTAKDNNTDDKDVIKIKLVQSNSDMIKKAVDISSGQIIPLNDAYAGIQ